MNNNENVYREKINNYLKTEADNIFFYWKGRVALYALLKAMGVGPGDEVIVQGYTCVVVPNAILYLEANPVYVDIDFDTYNINISELRKSITDKTKVIICQNTYGLSSNLEMIESIAKEYNIYTIEDCTHGFGGSYNGRPNGTYCDASFFSTQWSKPYTTGLGGFSVVHNNYIRKNVDELNKNLIVPSIIDCIELKLMYFVRSYIINDLTYWPMVRLYRWLSIKNVVIGSSSGDEIVGIQMPKNFFKGQSNTQYRKGIKSLRKLDALNKIRKENALKYTDLLMKLGKTYVDKTLFDNHIFIRYPLLVSNRELFKELAEREGIILGEWFESPIYPANNSLEMWALDRKKLPNATKICDRMVNLETSVKNNDKILRFLEKNSEYLI